MFGGFFVAGFHVKEGKVGVDQLLFRLELLGFVTFSDRGGKVALPIMGHSEGELSLKVGRFLLEDFFELNDGGVVVAGAEGEHGVIVLVLERHNFDKGNVVQDYGWAQVREAPDAASN